MGEGRRREGSEGGVGIGIGWGIGEVRSWGELVMANDGDGGREI